MNTSEVCLSDFITSNYVKSFLSKGYIPLKNGLGLINRKKRILLFGFDDLEYYLENFDVVKVFDVSEKDLELLKSLNHKFNTRKSDSVIFRFEPAFFELHGEKKKKIRHIRNKFEQKYILTIQNTLNHINDVIRFLKIWESQRKNIFEFHNGYVKNFLLTVLPFHSEQFICKFFYNGDELVGFTIIEKVGKNLYNQLYRKANLLDYSYLSLYIDYFAFNEINNDVNDVFFVNIGGSTGRKSLLQEKTSYFPVYRIAECFDISFIK